MGATVVVYTTEVCPYCVRAKALLKSKQAPYEEIRVDDRPDLRAWLVLKTHQRTVPQVFANGESLGGFSDLAELDRAGRLDPILSRPGRADDPPMPR